MGRGCTGVSAEGGKEGDEGLLGIGCADTRDTLITGGSKDEEPDAASRRPPPQPKGLMAKGFHAAPSDYSDTLLAPPRRGFFV
jgi:hypothetical protein